MTGIARVQTEKLTVLSDCSLIPPMPRGTPFSGKNGVYDTSGAFVQSANIRRDYKFELAPTALKKRPKSELSGTHLYGGQLNHHFGHFICETISRLWPLAENAEGAESILLMLRRPNASDKFQPFQTHVFNQLGLPIPVRIITEPVRIERLVVPEQGFGTGDLAAGSPEFRAYIKRHFAPSVAPSGPEKLYISREGLRLTKGGLFAEETLSKNLLREGYVEFRPENHDLETQIAHYRAAKQIVAVEGSALHLLGLVGHAGQSVAIIARRSDLAAAKALATQIEAFTEHPATLIDAIRREWDEGSGAHLSSKSMAELDYAQVRADLVRAGFVSDQNWTYPDPKIDERLARIAERTGRTLNLITRG